MNVTLAPLKPSRRNAGLRILRHGLTWLLVGAIFGALSFIAVSLFPNLGYWLGFLFSALIVWGGGQLLVGLTLYLSAGRSG